MMKRITAFECKPCISTMTLIENTKTTKTVTQPIHVYSTDVYSFWNLLHTTVYCQLLASKASGKNLKSCLNCHAASNKENVEIKLDSKQ